MANRRTSSDLGGRGPLTRSASAARATAVVTSASVVAIAPTVPMTAALLRSARIAEATCVIVAAMKEDVLEQIVDDYLKFRGYFTSHNVSFRPRKDHPEYVRTDDSVPSDVDVVGYHPRK